MSESVLYSFGIILALVGLYYLSEKLYKYFMCERNSEGVYTVIFHFGEDENLPDKVYSAMLLSEYKTFGKRDVYVVDMGFPDYIRLKCQLLTADMGTVHFIKGEDLRGLYKINSDNH